MDYRITIEQGAYALRGPKNWPLIDAIKTLPPKFRRWDGSTMAWIIAPEVIKQVAEMIRQAGYPVPVIPPFKSADAIFTKEFTVDYIGMAKERDGKPASALGSIKGYWSIEFPESVLREWFDKNKTTKLHSGQTHYQVLCVVESASDADIKAAHRRLARQWHPDVCQEDGAADKFREIQKAYEVLSTNRARYNAGLYFEREAQRHQSEITAPQTGSRYGRNSKFADNYRPPLRCGLITVEGRQSGYKFTVSKIVSWDDITDGAGSIMVSTWNKNRGPIDPKTGRPTGEIEITWR